MTLTPQQYAELIQRKPHLAPKSFSFTVHEDPSCSALQNPQPERDQAPALDRADAGEEKSVERPTIRFVGYRTRPLDPDNFAGSCKDLLDGLVRAGLLHGDEWWRIRLETEQVKVAHRSEERTEIVIELP